MSRSKRCGDKDILSRKNSDQKRIRQRFLLACSCSLFGVLAVILTVANLLNYRNLVAEADRTTAIIASYGGQLPREAIPPSPQQREQAEKDADKPSRKPDAPSAEEMPRDSSEATSNQPSDPNKAHKHQVPIPTESTGKDPDFKARATERDDELESAAGSKYFSAVADTEGTVQLLYKSERVTFADERALYRAKKVLETGKTDGFLDVYRFHVEETSEGLLLVIVDCRESLSTFSYNLRTSAVVSFAGWMLVLLLLLTNARLILAPMEEADRKQRQFLTDVSHELKTPLAIIEANTEMTELECGETKWTKSTVKQVNRLSYLVNQLLMLTRLEEQHTESVKEFSLSAVVSEAADAFQASARLGGKEIQTDIEREVIIRADEAGITQLLGLLLENAVKYSLPDSRIELSLTAQGRKRAVLQITNTSAPLPLGDNSELFERFYRADASRNSQNGGSGIGLAVARAIVDKEHGTITAASPDGKSLQISVVLPVIRRGSS